MNHIILNKIYIHLDFIKSIGDIQQPEVDSDEFFDDSGETEYPEYYFHYYFRVKMYEFKDKIIKGNREDVVKWRQQLVNVNY